MKKELEAKLRRIQGIQSRNPHDNFIVSAQVETIFMLDELSKQISKLNKTIEESDKQSRRLEKSNYRLQWALVILTAIGTMAIIYPFLVSIVNLVIPYISLLFNLKLESFMSIISVVLSVIVGFLTAIAEKSFFEKKFSEKIKIRDSIVAVLRDKDGNIKEIRDSKD